MANVYDVPQIEMRRHYPKVVGVTTQVVAIIGLAGAAMANCCSANNLQKIQ
jgi:hypothetical protein